MGTCEDVLRVAAREIGYHEGKNHHNKYGEWFGMDNCAWCVIFAAAWCYYYADIVGDVVGRKYREGGLYSCSQTLNWYRKHQPECITDKPIPGSLVIFDFPGTKYATDHMGLFVRMSKTTITTIDGNTSGSSDSNGGYVQQKTRKLSYANPVFIRPRELEEEMDIDKLIEDITADQVFRMASKLDGKQLYSLFTKMDEYMGTLELPNTWDAKREFDEAVAHHITDGSRPMCLTPRYQTSIMALRGGKNG